MKRILIMLGVVFAVVTMSFSSPVQPQAWIRITGVNGVDPNWQITGEIQDYNMLGMIASSFTTNDLIYSGYIAGSSDEFIITNVVSAAGIVLVVDIKYNEAGSPVAGAPQPGLQQICQVSTNGVSYLPATTIGQSLEYFQCAARNLNLVNLFYRQAVTNAMFDAWIGTNVVNIGLSITNYVPISMDTNWIYVNGKQLKGCVTNTTGGGVVSYGITDTTAYRGDWGNAVSNQIGAATVIYGITNGSAYRGDWGNILTGKVDQLQLDTGSLNTAVGNLNTSTTTLNSAVANLNTSTTTLNAAVAQLKLDTNSINAAMFRKDGTVAMTGGFNGGGQSVTNLSRIDFNGDDTAVGLLANASSFGTAVGRGANGNTDGTAVGYGANASINGVAIGENANGYFKGVAIGLNANGWNSGVAIGFTASATNNNVAIGYNVINTEPNSTMLKGNLNMNGNNATNAGALQAASLQITGKATTNSMTAVWGCTNAATGQGSLNVLPKIAAQNNAATIFASGGQKVIPFATTTSQVGGTWDGSNWTPNVIGWIAMEAHGRMGNNFASNSEIGFGKNGAVFQRHNTEAHIFWDVSIVHYNEAITNSYCVFAMVQSTQTNSTIQPSYFNGAVLP